MKTDTIKKELDDPIRTICKKSEMILKDKNLISENSKEKSIENVEDEEKNGKSDCQLEKQTETDEEKKKEDDREDEKDEKDDDKENVQTEEKTLIDLLKRKCTLQEKNDDEIISRSPMRIQDYQHNHHGKPYGGYPFSASSRTLNGVTRVVETNLPDQNSFQNGYPHSQWPLMGNETNENLSEIDIRAVEDFSSLCNKFPEFLESFVNNFNELDEVNHQKEVLNRDQYRNTRRSVCSSSSSQFSSPAPSPSEYSGAGLDFNTNEENSLYLPKSPNIPPLEGINIRSDYDDLDKILEKPASPKEEEIIHELKDLTYLNIPSNASNDMNVTSPVMGTSPPNIGTDLRNVADVLYENPIDLNPYCKNREPKINSSQNFSTFEKDCLNEKLDPKAKESAWTRISQLDVKLLGQGDKEGDTQLMILLVSEKVTLEYIYVIVERLLKEDASYLALKNEQNQDALYLAARKGALDPVVASYIAEALIRGKQDVNVKYDEGNTLLHCLAKLGDSHAKVLKRLLQLKNTNNTPAFDVNRKNNRGFTPLHIACEVHKPNAPYTFEVVQILQENGASCIDKDYIDENTPLHTLIAASCDIELLRVLLENADKYGKKDGQSATTIPNRQLDTALHLACRRNTLPLQVQKEVVEILLRHGAMIQLKNINGFVPSVLVENTRKMEIKNILHSYRQK